MKREEKNTLSRQRILDAALREFSAKGYDAASLNTLCAQNDISKGILYHYFKDKDELYLLCAADCFNNLTEFLAKSIQKTGNTEQRLQSYFDSRLHFFAKNPLYLGIFLNVTLMPPPQLAQRLAQVKQPFDLLNIEILTALLQSAPLRAGLGVSSVVEDTRMYMDYFNARFRSILEQSADSKQALFEHEERCHRQLNILLYGVLAKQDEKTK